MLYLCIYVCMCARGALFTKRIAGKDGKKKIKMVYSNGMVKIEKIRIYFINIR